MRLSLRVKMVYLPCGSWGRCEYLMVVVVGTEVSRAVEPQSARGVIRISRAAASAIRQRATVEKGVLLCQSS